MLVNDPASPGTRLKFHNVAGPDLQRTLPLDLNTSTTSENDEHLVHFGVRGLPHRVLPETARHTDGRFPGSLYALTCCMQHS